jgi:chromosome condensin MukBEF MukE localization factor
LATTFVAGRGTEPARHRKTRRVDSAGFLVSRCELRDPRYLIDIANLLKTRYRLSRVECAAIRYPPGFEVVSMKRTGMLRAFHTKENDNATGTLLLFFYEQPPYYTKPAMIAALIKRNKRRQLLQRAGLGLIMLSFVLAGFSVLS